MEGFVELPVALGLFKWDPEARVPEPVLSWLFKFLFCSVINYFWFGNYIEAFVLIIRFEPDTFGTLWSNLIFCAGPFPGLSAEMSFASSPSILASASSELISCVLFSEDFRFCCRVFRFWYYCYWLSGGYASSYLALLFWRLVLPRLWLILEIFWLNTWVIFWMFWAIDIWLFWPADCFRSWEEPCVGGLAFWLILPYYFSYFELWKFFLTLAVLF